MKVAAAVVRFQTDNLHEGHEFLLGTMKLNADVVCVVLGLDENRGSKRNPLDFITRKLMIEEWWSRHGGLTPLVILPQHNQPKDEVWSANLDRMLGDAFPGQHITLYGGRDSFLKHYKGKLRTEQVIFSSPELSATERRKEIAAQPGFTPEFRRGVIYGCNNVWPRLFMCVDVALFSQTRRSLIVGKRKAEDKLRFFGGFVDQSDPSLEYAARRELREEAGATAYLEYLGSFKVDDYRYRSADDGLAMTTLFLGAHTVPFDSKAGDDIDEIVELSLDDTRTGLVEGMVKSHQPLMNAVLDELEHRGVYNADVPF